jgi:protein-tyrosine-phosphatase
MSSVETDSQDRAVSERATAAYWQARYDALTAGVEGIDNDPDPEALLIMANAAFRNAQRAAQQPRPAQVQQLDLVLQAYATALKSPVFLADAAYNYEYVVRMREALARARGPAGASAAKPDAPRAGDLPAGPTIHGRPGGPPPSTKGEEFEILTPMEYGDREAQPEATPGVKPLRKG